MSYVELTNDMYSFHTLELKTRTDGKAFEDVLNSLYHKDNGTNKRTYEVSKYNSNDKTVYCSTVLSKHGILLYLTASKKGKYHKFTIKAKINPRRVLNPNSGYLGIMPPGTDCLERFRDEFAILMWRYNMPGYLDEWTLTRDDLCVNLQYDKKKSAREQCRLIQKDLLPSKTEQVFFFNPDSSPEEQKAQKDKDRHSFKLENGSYALTVYDKLYQMEMEGLEAGSKVLKLPKGVLRIELQCKPAYLKKISKKQGLDTTYEQIQYLMENSRSLILKYIKRAFSCGTHYKPNAAIAMIQASSLHESTRTQLIWMFKRMRYSFNIQQLEKGMAKNFGLKPRTVAKRLKQLHKLGIHPVPLRKDFYLDQLPSLPEILEHLDDDGTSIRLNSDGSIDNCPFNPVFFE